MFDRLSNGWGLAKDAFRVVSLDKELLLFPLMSGICCSLVVASFILPLVGSGYLDGMTEEQVEALGQNPIAYVVGFAFYFCNYFVITFFNVALVACAIIRFNGGDPGIGDGLRAAGKRLPQIVGWALVAATVGMILKVIESRSEKAGRFAAGLLGTAWSIAAYFVIPALVVEKLGPIAALKRSVSILKDTWGEALGANFSLGFINFLMTILAIGIGTAAGALINPVVGVCVGVILLIIVGLISSAVKTIVIGALYEYAHYGRTPEQFDRDSLRFAFGGR